MLWWLLLYYVNLCMINISVVHGLTCLWTVFGHLFVTLFIGVSVLHIIICFSFSRATSTSNCWGSRTYYWGVLIVVFVIFLAIHWCWDHHVTCCSCLSFLSTRYCGEILCSCLLILVIWILVLYFWHCCLPRRFNLQIWDRSCILIRLPLVLRILSILLLAYIHPIVVRLSWATILSMSMGDMAKHNLFPTLPQIASHCSWIFNNLSNSPSCTLLL